MSVLDLAPTTELEAVNEMLSAIGESPVGSLDTTDFADVQVALSILRGISRRVQKIGCHFNTEIGYRLIPNTDGEIVIPRATLQVDEIHPEDDPFRDIVSRAGKLYDRNGHTFQFTSPVYVDLVLLLPFEDCPESFRDYVTIRAARVFADRLLGEANTHRFTQEDEMSAKNDFTRAEVKTRDANMLNNLHSQRIVNRKQLFR